MLRSPLDWTLWLLVIGGPFLLARRRRGQDAITLAVVVGVLCISAHLILAPAGLPGASGIALGILVAFDLAMLFPGPSVERRLVSIARRPAAKAALAVLGAILVPLALAEAACRVLTDAQVLRYQCGIETVNRSGSDDWRMATITGAEAHEPDPVLLWRPAARKPFNAQRFKGSLVEVPKPSGVVRVMCYGDSLTDGPPRGGWPSKLGDLLKRQPPLPGRRFEVVNAGVAGYSSHQGVLRFVQEVDQYDPDLILVSFGWNDAAQAIGQPDKSFEVPPLALVNCQRALVRFRAYLVLMYYSRQWRTTEPRAVSEPSGPRVSLADYVANLDRFRSEAQARRIPIVFLTRPHRLAVAEQSKIPTWRGTVPRYNEALNSWARDRRLPVIDVQEFFERRRADSFVDECHFRPEGYQRMGALVYERLIAQPAGPLMLAAGRSSRGSAPGRTSSTSPPSGAADRYFARR
jgi:lysophospholipase L1-like esterase